MRFTNSKVTYKCWLLAALNTWQLLTPHDARGSTEFIVNYIQVTRADVLGDEKVWKIRWTVGDRHHDADVPFTSLGRFRNTEQSWERPQWRGSYLTLPPRPARFLCAPQPSWPTCRGAAPWLPWWPGPAPVGSGESTVSRGRGSFSGWLYTSIAITWDPSLLLPRQFHCCIWGSKRFEMGSFFILENASHFPRFPISPVHCQIMIHVGETRWLWIPLSLARTVRRGENRSSLTLGLSSATWDLC